MPEASCVANPLKNLCCVDKIASPRFRNGRHKVSLLGGVELKCLVTLVSQYGDGSAVGKVFGFDLNHAVVAFASGNHHSRILAPPEASRKVPEGDSWENQDRRYRSTYTSTNSFI